MCNAYYQCAHGHQFPDQFCPDDLLFNGEVCDQPENVTCPTVEYDVTAYSCEHPSENHNQAQAGEQNALLQCDQGFVIRVNSATYGKPTLDQCVSQNANQQNLTCGSTADHSVIITLQMPRLNAMANKLVLIMEQTKLQVIHVAVLLNIPLSNIHVSKTEIFHFRK